jgi:hypothetical protein
MAYTHINFKTKKELKQAVLDGKQITVYQPDYFLRGMLPCPTNGRVYLEGPHFPQAHTWYAEATLVNGIVTKVK